MSKNKKQDVFEQVRKETIEHKIRLEEEVKILDGYELVKEGKCKKDDMMYNDKDKIFVQVAVSDIGLTVDRFWLLIRRKK